VGDVNSVLAMSGGRWYPLRFDRSGGARYPGAAERTKDALLASRVTSSLRWPMSRGADKR
jgi:hypothetical protein